MYRTAVSDGLRQHSPRAAYFWDAWGAGREGFIRDVDSEVALFARHVVSDSELAAYPPMAGSAIRLVAIALNHAQ